MRILTTVRAAFAAILISAAGAASADHPGWTYRVEITNLTRGQSFTPLLLATHDRSVALFEVGEPAGEPHEILAEAGDTAPLEAKLSEAGRAVRDVVPGSGLTAPGQTVTFEIRAHPFRDVLSLAGMLIPTNETFVGLDAVRLPIGRTVVYAAAYDAGTEGNDQSCAHMPGPRCGGEGYSPAPADDDEGFVYVGNGFHTLGDSDAEGFEVLGPLTYDWNNPVARIEISRVRGRR